MSDNGARILCGLTIFISLVLPITPAPFAVPMWLEILKPEWIVLCWFFWVINRPRIVSLTAAFFVGLIVDAILDEPLGLNSTILLALIFIANQARTWIAISPGIYSTLAILVLCFLTIVLKALVMYIAFDIEIVTMSLILPPLATTLAWIPLIPVLTSEFSILDDQFE